MTKQSLGHSLQLRSLNLRSKNISRINFALDINNHVTACPPFIDSHLYVPILSIFAPTSTVRSEQLLAAEEEIDKVQDRGTAAMWS